MKETQLEIHNDDRIKMARTVEISKRSPATEKFRVGCVITDKNGKELATGFTAEEPGFHAEEIAIKKLKASGLEAQALGGSIFSTVEPCHPRLSGKTACTDHILTLGLSRVLYVLDEPPIFVKCEGAKTLREKGFKVIIMPEFKEEVLRINEHIIK